MKKNNDGSIKKLYISGDDKKLSGVCGGIAEYLEIDPTVVRLTWIIITLISGVIPGIVAYILAIIIMPKEKSADLQELHTKHV